MRQARIDESAYESHDGDHGGFSGQWSPHCVDCRPGASVLGRLIRGKAPVAEGDSPEVLAKSDGSDSGSAA